MFGSMMIWACQLVSSELLPQWKNNKGFSNSSSADGLDVGARDINMQQIYILYDRRHDWWFLSSRFLNWFMLKSQNTRDIVISHQQVVFSIRATQCHVMGPVSTLPQTWKLAPCGPTTPHANAWRTPTYRFIQLVHVDLIRCKTGKYQRNR